LSWEGRAVVRITEIKRWRNLWGTQLKSKGDMSDITLHHSKNWSSSVTHWTQPFPQATKCVQSPLHRGGCVIMCVCVPTMLMCHHGLRKCVCVVCVCLSCMFRYFAPGIIIRMCVCV
jgi:hypothetical protein